jgi:integrase
MARKDTPSKTPRYVLDGARKPLTDAEGRRYFRGKIRLLDDSLKRVEIPEPDRFDEAKARKHLADRQDDENKTHAIYNAERAVSAVREALTAGAAGETCGAWYRRFMKFRDDEVDSVADDMHRWNKWIAPHIGPKPIREITPDHIENIRDALNVAVIAYEQAGNVGAEGRLAPHTAQNVWSALTTPFKYASTRKGPRELRVREDLGNPCLGIPPPRDGASKQRHWLRPGEIIAVVSAPSTPRPWQEAIAIGCYLHLRPGELHELRIKDLDLASVEVRITRAYDERKKVVKSPKTEEGIRTVTIPVTLMPLLERIARGGKAEDRVAPIVAATEEYFRAGLFRSFLEAAGVKRAELYVETPTHLMIDFRSLRDSGITWRFLANERAEVVQREAGHDQISTTLGYAKEVSSRGGRFGEPFPALPMELIEPPAPSSPVHESPPPVHAAAKVLKELWAQRDLNPRPTD